MDIHAQRMLVEKKLQALSVLRQTTLVDFQKLDREILSIQNETKKLSKTFDTVAAVATPIALGAKQIFASGLAFQRGLISVAQAEKEILKSVTQRSWGVGVTPLGSGMTQGVAQIHLSEKRILEPRARDGLVIAFGKEIAQLLLDMWSPSYWAKLIAGDPNAACQRALQRNQRTKQLAISRIDKSISNCRDVLVLLRRGIDVNTLT